jgi:hypothetical protein
MNESKETPKRGKGGRPPRSDPAGNCAMVRFSDAQFAGFLTMCEQSVILTTFLKILGNEYRMGQFLDLE